MNKTKNIIWIITIIILCALIFVFMNMNNKNSDTIQQQPLFDNEITTTSDVFSDGLNNPDSTITFPLGPDEIGIASKTTYLVDINHDGKPDKITKTLHETGNAHSYYDYTIELAQDKGYIDITPKNFRTTNGVDCDLQQIQFKFKPTFTVTLIYRELGDTWLQPTLAYKQTFSLSGNEMKASKPQQLRKICDVKELF